MQKFISIECGTLYFYRFFYTLPSIERVEMEYAHPETRTEFAYEWNEVCTRTCNFHIQYQ